MNCKKITGLVLLFALLGPMLGMAGAVTVTRRPTINEVGLVVTAYEDGTYRELDQSAEIARENETVATGIHFENITIPNNATVTSATLKLWYSNGFDWGGGTRNVVIEAIYGSPDQLTWDLIFNGPTTAQYVTYNISQWNVSAYYEIDVTDIVGELQNLAGWSSGDNITIRTISSGGGEGSGYADTPYSYWYTSNRGSNYARRPTLTIEYEEGNNYKGWTISPVSGGGNFSGILIERSGFVDLAVYNGSDWTSYNVTDSTGHDRVKQFNSQSDQGVAVNDTLYFGLSNASIGLGAITMPLNDPGNFTVLANLTGTEQPRTWTVVYYPEYESINYIWMWANGSLYHQYYTPQNDTWSSKNEFHTGKGSNGKTVDAKYSAINKKIVLTTCTSDGGGSAIHIRYKDFDGSWGNGKEWTDYQPAYTVVGTSQVTGTLWTYGAGFPTFQPGYDYDEDNGTNWGAWYKYGGYNINEYDLHSFQLGNTTWFFYIDFGGDIVGMEFLNGSSTATNLSGGLPTDVYDDPDGDSIRHLTSFTYNGSRMLVAVDNADDFMLFDSIFNEVGGNDPNVTGLNDLSGIDSLYVSAPVSGGGYTPTPPPDDPNNTCVNTYLTSNYGGGSWTVEQIQEAIDHCNSETTDPEDPTGGGFTGDEPSYLDRQSVKLYFTVLGLLGLIAPWAYLSLNREWGALPWVLFINLFALALLYGVSSI